MYTLKIGLIKFLDSERSLKASGFTIVFILDSERSDECIDFTMMCVRFWAKRLMY